MLQPHDLYLVAAFICGFFAIAQSIAVILEARLPLSGFIACLFAIFFTYKAYDLNENMLNIKELLDSSIRLWAYIF